MLNKNKYHLYILYILALFSILIFLSPQAFSQEKKNTTAQKLALQQSVICEGIQNFEPQNPAVVFSISIGKVYCFSYFEPVPDKTAIYHNWYFRDRLTSRLKLTLKPPKWRTYSMIQLREADRGPWRVEITDPRGHIFKVLRFSITD